MIRLFIHHYHITPLSAADIFSHLTNVAIQKTADNYDERTGNMIIITITIIVATTKMIDTTQNTMLLPIMS